MTATHLFVNFDGKNLTASLLDAATGEPIAPFTLENSVPLDASNSTRSALAWRNEPSNGIAQLRGRAVRVRFRWGQRGEASSLYSFWVATSKCGASRGYVAGGGPGIDGDVDLKGSCEHKTDDEWTLPGSKDDFVAVAGERQLFLTEHGIAQLQGLRRTMHKANKKGAVIRSSVDKVTHTFSNSNPTTRSSPMWVPEEERFRYVVMHTTPTTPNNEPARWYSSPDLVQWQFEEPANSSSVAGLSLYHCIRDATDPDPTARYKSNVPPMMDPTGVGGMAVSADGVQWRKVAAGVGIESSDEQGLSLDPKAHRFIYTVKRGNKWGRAVALATTTDFYARDWQDLGIVFGADDLDQVIGREEIRKRLGDSTLAQPMCARSQAERDMSPVHDGACFNTSCPVGHADQKMLETHVGIPPPCWNVDMYQMGVFRCKMYSLSLCASAPPESISLADESVYMGVPALYHVSL